MATSFTPRQHKDGSRPFVVMQAWSAESDASKTATRPAIFIGCVQGSGVQAPTLVSISGSSAAAAASHTPTEDGHAQTSAVFDMLPRLHMHRSPRPKRNACSGFGPGTTNTVSCSLSEGVAKVAVSSPPSLMTSRSVPVMLSTGEVSTKIPSPPTSPPTDAASRGLFRRKFRACS